MRALAMISQQLAINWQFVSAFVFWALVAPTYFWDIGMEWRVKLSLAHSIPPVIHVIDLMITDSVIRLRDFWQSFLTCVLYAIVNYYYGIIQGEPVYKFLTWEDPIYSSFVCLMWWVVGEVSCLFFGVIQDLLLGNIKPKWCKKKYATHETELK